MKSVKVSSMELIKLGSWFAPTALVNLYVLIPRAASFARLRTLPWADIVAAFSGEYNDVH